MVIRRAQEKDMDGIKKLLLQVCMVHHNGRPDLFKGENSRKYTDEQLKGIIHDDGRPIFVSVDEEETVLGYAFCIFQQHLNDNILTDIKTLYIDDLCVDENIRGRHIGRKLYDAVLSFAGESGCYNVTLNVWNLNEAAMKFYESCGLRPQKIGMETILEKKTAVLIVDMQTALVRRNQDRLTETLDKISALTAFARKKGMEVVYIRHDGGEGDELEKNTPGWEIFQEIAPAGTERIFDKCFNSAFHRTGLHDYLQGKGIEKIILTGMQTEYCIDATCKAAFDLGYEVVIPKGATATFDNALASGEKLTEYYEEKIWKNRFAKVLPIEELIDR